MKPFSILFLGTQMTVGGAQQVLFSQASWFHQQGYKVHSAFFYDKENLESEWGTKYPFQVINIQAWQDGRNPLINCFRLFLGLFRLWVLLRREKIDVIETFTPDTNLFGLVIARLAGIPVRIASHHGVIEGRSQIFTKLHTQLINWDFADTLVVVSERVHRIVVEEDGVKPEKVQVILNGVKPFDTADLPSGNREKLLEELKIKENQYVVLSVGRISGQKGHTYLLDAIPNVLEQFPETVFIIAGDGPLRKELESKTLQMGLRPNVFFLGTRPDVPALLSIADLFVLPSISEGMPIALLEAMGMGVPSVASKLDQISAFMDEGVQGLLFEPKDVKALSDVIVVLLENHPLREEIGKAGQALVSECYTVDQMCLAYEHLFLCKSGVITE